MAYGLERAKNHYLPTYYFPYFRKQVTREEYETQIVSLLNKLQPELIILAGWMHVWTSVFCSKYGNITLNLHPAFTGIMCHKVIEEIDAGEVLSAMKIPIIMIN